MSKNLELTEIVERSKEIGPRLKRFYEKYLGLEEFNSCISLTPDEKYNFLLLYQTVDLLENAFELLEIMSKPVRFKGCLQKNSIGKYEVDGYELTSGARLEVWMRFNEEEHGYFVPSQIEQDGENYYIAALGRDIKIDDVLVRVK